MYIYMVILRGRRRKKSKIKIHKYGQRGVLIIKWPHTNEEILLRKLTTDKKSQHSEIYVPFRIGSNINQQIR